MKPKFIVLLSAYLSSLDAASANNSTSPSNTTLPGATLHQKESSLTQLSSRFIDGEEEMGGESDIPPNLLKADEPVDFSQKTQEKEEVKKEDKPKQAKAPAKIEIDSVGLEQSEDNSTANATVGAA